MQVIILTPLTCCTVHESLHARVTQKQFRQMTGFVVFILQEATIIDFLHSLCSERNSNYKNKLKLIMMQQRKLSVCPCVHLISLSSDDKMSFKITVIKNLNGNSRQMARQSVKRERETEKYLTWANMTTICSCMHSNDFPMGVGKRKVCGCVDNFTLRLGRSICSKRGLFDE
jgi:hypothetical protein